MKNPSPYYAVIFTTQRTETDLGYKEMAKKMEDLAALQPGFLGYETARGDIGISISYWESLEAITQWKNHADHLEAQKLGRAKWYQWYKLRICKVEREYDFQRQDKG
ncbi:antibiotic biosynthesis monooxygenase family protein [Muriicola soli]|uniref:Antibiotic biosynthesis monooxygenase n=1 Tax=Muriicola soli TaxID=2507538 RepID=A0A411ECV4_9FLAO|nr:antibiotic biosynthesis monooxygenase [Muriicola soli]QBA65230.1 antibiotic biosynthesis monooxygenase [Muriicola soli]